MRQDKFTYQLEIRRQGQVEYSEHGGMTKHPLPRDKERNGGLSRETKHEPGQIHIQTRDKKARAG